MAVPKIAGPWSIDVTYRFRAFMRDWSDRVTTSEVVKLYGAAWSVYVQIARLALEEKQIKYSLVEVDIFAETGVPQEQLKRHPFGHSGLRAWRFPCLRGTRDRSLNRRRFPRLQAAADKSESSRPGKPDCWNTGCLCVSNAYLGYIR
jgi:hypothetical protein